MHDFLLAKEIIEGVLKIAQENKLSKISKVYLELGQIALAHDGFGDHVEEINLDNLQFGIKNITKGMILENTDFEIKKIEGENWKIIGINGE